MSDENLRDRHEMVRVWGADIGALDDIARLMSLFRESMGRCSPSEDAFASRISELLEREEAEFLLASLDGGEPCAVAQLRYRSSVWVDGLDCCLEDLYVEEEVRGFGIGRELVRSALERAHEKGARRIQLDVNETNERARSLYEGMGFSAFSEAAGGNDLFSQRGLP